MEPFFLNRCFEKNNLKALIAWSLLNFGERKTLNLVEKLKNLGFMYATQAGISLSLDDLKTPPTKIWLISDAEYQTATTKKEYYQGNLTAVEKFQQLIDTWHRTSELLKQDVIENFKSTDILNPVYMMAFSGARGNISQVRQLVGMRGLMADPQGQIIDFPIRSNFREGLTLTEYVISCYGARKGLVDTALRTANSGYLTRRLVDVSQHVIIGWMNCGTNRGISLGNMIVENKIILPLQNRLVGRVLAEDILPIAVKNQQISLELGYKIAQLKENILVRSPLTCKHKKFLCQFCYGWSLAYGNLVAMGEAVGVLAAQSIGEPGTQLTMRTFHTGGVFSGGVVDEIRAPFNGFVFFNKSLPGKLIRTSYGKIAFFTKKPGEVLFYSSSSINAVGPATSNSRIEEPFNAAFAPGAGQGAGSAKSSLFLHLDKEESKQKIKFFLPECTILFVRNAGKIYKGQLVAEFSSITDKKNEQIRAEHRVYSEIAGQIFLKKTIQFLPSKSKISPGFKEEIDSLWILSGKIYKSAIASPFFVKKGDYLDSTTTINQSLGFTTNIGTISSYLSPKKKQFSGFKLFPPQVAIAEKSKGERSKGQGVYQNKKKNRMTMPLDNEKVRTSSAAAYSVGGKNLKINEAKQIVLKQPLLNLVIKTPHYKRFSYFFSLPVNQFSNDAYAKGQVQSVSFAENQLNRGAQQPTPLVDCKIERQPADLLFTTSSLKDNIAQFAKNDRLESSKKPVLYQWFPKTYQTKTAGLLLSSKFTIENFSFDKVLFWISEESYQIPYFLNESFANTGKASINLERSTASSKLKGPLAGSASKSKNQKLIFSGYTRGWNGQEIPLFYTNNRQFRKKPTYLKAGGFFQSTEYLCPFPLKSVQKKINFKKKKNNQIKNLINQNYLKKSFFLSFTLFPSLPFEVNFCRAWQVSKPRRATLPLTFLNHDQGRANAKGYISKTTPYILSSNEVGGSAAKINGEASTSNNFIFLAKKNILKKLSKPYFVGQRRPEKENSLAFYSFSFDPLNFFDLLYFTRRSGAKARAKAESIKIRLTFPSQAISSKARVENIVNGDSIMKKAEISSGDKKLTTSFSLLTFKHLNPFSLGTKKLHLCFFQRLAFFTKKNTTDNRKRFLENPLFLVKMKSKDRAKQNANRAARPHILPATQPKQNLQVKETGSQRNNKNPQINHQMKSLINQDPLKEIALSAYLAKQASRHTHRLPSLLLGESLLTKDSFSKKNCTRLTNEKTEIKKNSFYALQPKKWSKKEIKVTFLSFYKRFHLKKTNYSNIVKLFPFLCDLKPQSSELRKMQNWNEKQEKIKSHYRVTAVQTEKIKKVKVKSGWVYFPQDDKKLVKNLITISSSKLGAQSQGWKKIESIQFNNTEIDDLAFDQQIIFSDYLRLFWTNGVGCYSVPSQYSKLPQQEGLNLNTLNNKDIFRPFLTKIQREKFYLKNFNQIKQEEPTTLKSNKVIFKKRAEPTFLKENDTLTNKSKYKFFETKKVRNFTLAQKNAKSAYKNRQIHELKSRLGLSYFFLTNKSYEEKKKEGWPNLVRETIFLDQQSTPLRCQNKKFKNVIVSSRENQEFNFKLLQEKKSFSLLRNLITSSTNIERANQKHPNIGLDPLTYYASKRKRTNPWIKRNLQLIINKKDGPAEPTWSLDTEKISKKLHTFCIGSLTKETVKNAKKSLSFSSINSVNSDLSKRIASEKVLTKSSRRANLVFFFQLKSKNEDISLKKILSQKKTQTENKNGISEAISSITNNPYNMFLFGIPQASSREKGIAYPASLFSGDAEQELGSAQVKEITKLISLGKNRKTNKIKPEKKLVFSAGLPLRSFKTSKPKFLVLFRKIRPYSLLETGEYKKRVYSSNEKEIFFESFLSSNFTRQKKTKLFSSEPSHDLQIKRLIPLGFQKDAPLITKFFDKIVLQRLTIVASPSLKLGLNAITTKIHSTRLNRKGFFNKTFFLSAYTFGAFCVGNISSKKSGSSFTKESWISTNRPIFLTDYLSPYNGEIAKSHSNSSCIIITNADQITVSTSCFNTQKITEPTSCSNEVASKEISLNKSQPFAFIGQLIRSGEEIALNNGLLQSGQIIQIETGKITLRIAYPLLLSFGSIFHVQHTSFVEKKAQLFTLFYQIVKTGDIVQGIPKIEQLFEARGPLIEGRGTEERHLFASGLSARFWRIYLNYSQKFSNKIAVRKSFEEIQQIIVQEVYMVYQEQGVNLAEKHLEIIVRQMTSFVLIVNPGGTRFLPGEILPLPLVEKANNYLLFLDVTSSISHAPYYAQYVPVLFGITKAALRSEGFISAASFQETTRILSQAAIEKRKDYLRGLKENVVLGRVIPAGTGFPIWRWKKAVSSLPLQKGTPKGKLQSVMSRFDAESLDSLIL